MIKRPSARSAPAPEPQSELRSMLRAEAPTILGILSLAAISLFHGPLFADLHNYPLTALLFLWLFATMLWCAFGVVRHAEALAERLGEPYGTLLLTLPVIAIEVALLASVMLHGDNNPTLARDAMFATLMIVLNFMVGMALVMGALRYFEQEYNLGGARAYLAVIASLAAFTLILPNHMRTEPDPSQAPLKTLLFAAIPILFYAVFVIIQTMRHRALFDEPAPENAAKPARRKRAQHKRASRSLGYHLTMLWSRCSPWCCSPSISP
jgi:Ca2+:H+ antiporter